MGSLANYGSKWSRACQASASIGCDIISVSLLSPHLLRRFFTREQSFQPWCDRYVTKLFDHHFCSDRCSIFVYHLHVSKLTAMHTFSIVLVLLKQHAFFHRHQSSHSSFRDRIQSFWTGISVSACYASLG
jgi:hypothetical protein